MANNQIPSLAFHHIAIQVKDFDTEKKFFIEGLGLKPYAEWKSGKNGEKTICLLELGNGGFVELFSGGSGEAIANSRFLHFAMQVADVEAAYACAIKAGAESVKQPTVVPVASAPAKLTLQCAFVRAPGGYELEFFRVLEAIEA